MFLSDIGLEEPGVAKLIRSAYALLKLQTYFTAGEKEVRAWTVKEGSTAPQAAGVIHTDFEKGFHSRGGHEVRGLCGLGQRASCQRSWKVERGRQGVHRAGWGHHALPIQRLKRHAILCGSLNDRGVQPGL